MVHPFTKKTSGYTKKRGLKPLSICVDKAIKPALKQRGFAESRMLTDWPLIVGEALAVQTSVQRIRFPKGSQADGVLYVEVYHSGLATELVYMAPLLMEKIAVYFGYKAVSSIKWIQRPGYKKKAPAILKQPTMATENGQKEVRQIVETCKDDTMRTALEKLGQHVFGALGK